MIEVDLKHGFDLTQRENVQFLRGVLAQGLITAVHLGTPCSSFSRARERGGGGPPPLRSDDHPLGRPDLKPHDLVKVQIGNKCAQVTVSLAYTALLHGIPGSIENPATSRLFRMPGIMRFMKHKYVKDINLDFCCYGTPWRKRTKLVFWFLDLTPLNRICSSAKGICDHTGRQHHRLEGIEPNSKQFWTLIAEPYPQKYVPLGLVVLTICWPLELL